MSRIKITIGQFIKTRQNSPDTFEDQFVDASGLPKPENYVLDDLVSPDVEKIQLAQQAPEDPRNVGSYLGPQEHIVGFSETRTVPASLQQGPNIGVYAGPSEVIVGTADPYSHSETDSTVETGGHLLPGHQVQNVADLPLDNYNEEEGSGLTQFMKDNRSLPGNQIPNVADLPLDNYDEESRTTSFLSQQLNLPGFQEDVNTNRFAGDTYNEAEERRQPLYGNKNAFDDRNVNVDAYNERNENIGGRPTPGFQEPAVVSDNYDERNSLTSFSDARRGMPGFQNDAPANFNYEEDPDIVQTTTFLKSQVKLPGYQDAQVDIRDELRRNDEQSQQVPQPFAGSIETSGNPTQLERLATQDRAIGEMVARLDAGESFEGIGGIGGVLGMPGGSSWDPVLWATKYLPNQTKEYHAGSSRESSSIDAGKIAYHSATQLLLFLMNRQARTNIWNPLLMFPPPILQDFLLPTIDSQIAVGLGTITGDTALHEINTLQSPAGDTTILGKHLGDRHEAYAQGILNDTYIDPTKPPFVHSVTAGGLIGPQNSEFFKTRVYGAPSQDQVLVENKLQVPTKPGIFTEIDEALTTRNKYFAKANHLAPERKYPDNAPFSMGQMVDEALGSSTSNLVTLVKKSETDTRLTFGTSKTRRGKAYEIGTEKKYARGIEHIPNAISLFDSQKDPIRKDKLYDAHGNDGDIAVYYNISNQDDKTNGCMYHDLVDVPNKFIDDDVAFVPLCFTDLRRYSAKQFGLAGNFVRTVYFRPFITSFSEATTPEWNKQSYYGRADPVVIWSSVTRTVNLGFKIAAFGPEDIDVIYKKLKWLQSMTYAQYDEHLNLKSGPAVRMRIGDVISNVTLDSDGVKGRHGLSGIIDSLNFEYSTATWELAKGRKVPMHVDVTLSFTALHDRPIGLDLAGNFGGLGAMSKGAIVTPQAIDDNQSTSEYKKIIRDAEYSFRYVGDLDSSGT